MSRQNLQQIVLERPPKNNTDAPFSRHRTLTGAIQGPVNPQARKQKTMHPAVRHALNNFLLG